MALVEYRRKRRFKQTPEPVGKAAKRTAVRERQFVVQMHDARRLHYDLRLELDGVLLSWAVPKGPSLDPQDKRLAVRVEDHPLEYAQFEGKIPAGQYGAGDVIVWDRGTWTPGGDPRAALQAGNLEFQLEGEKLHGGWRLVRIRDGSSRRENWLLIKRNDDAARAAGQYDVTERMPQSVKSGKRLDRASGAARQSAEAANFPLALATLAPRPPEGDGWLHEIKLDGYRLLAMTGPAGGRKRAARLFTRSGLDWSARYPAIAAAAADLPVKSAVLDGELVALDESGISRFQLLQSAADSGSRLVYFVFDLLQLDGEDLRPQPLAARKQRLARLLAGDRFDPIRYSDHLQGRGADFLAECCRSGLEGIVSKRGDKPYRAGRSRDWLKIKCRGQEELVIGGFTDSPTAARNLGALLVGYFREGQLIYAGRVGTGFDDKALRSLHRTLKKREQPKSPFVRLPAKERRRGVHYVRPQLVAQIEFGSWTDSEILRHASFQGLRDDKAAADVGQPESLAGTSASKQATMPTRKSTRPRASQPAASVVALTHPERVLYPDLGLTKQELADYYADISERILPHVAGRPLSMLRCPDGMGAACFFQKHVAAGTPAVLRRVSIAEKHAQKDYLVVDNAEGLRALAQISVLEIHPWGAQAPEIEQPDRLIFDLDPGPGVSWKAVIDAALAVRDVLARLELTTFVKTSGGKGLHVVAPLAGGVSWPQLKQFSRAIAEHLAQEHPDRFTATMAKAARKGRVFIDYLRNDRGATAVAPYSPRALPGAPVSMPLAWKDLPACQSPQQFTLRSIAKGGRRASREAWRDFFATRQQLPPFASQPLRG
jgi:bifunctional non-homologous end joining protein LigD